MHLEKTSLILEKINNLHYTMIKNPDHISSIEKDLLKDYVKALYEALQERPSGKASQPKPVERSVTKASKVPPVEPTPVIIETPAPGAQPDNSDSIEENPIASAPEKTEYKPPRIIEVPKALKEEIASTPPKEVDEVKHEAPAAQLDDAMHDLFNDDEDKNDLSARLANSPIKDLTKAISINEKIFTVNELFDGNTIDFDQTLKALNGAKGWEAALNGVLTEKAMEYKWTEELRVKKAKKFIKLIRRRYL